MRLSPREKHSCAGVSAAFSRSLWPPRPPNTSSSWCPLCRPSLGICSTAGGPLGELPRSPTALQHRHAWVREEMWSCRSQVTREGSIPTPPFSTNRRPLFLRAVIPHHSLQGGGCGQASRKAPEMRLSCFRAGGRDCSVHTEGCYLEGGSTGTCQGLGPCRDLVTSSLV